MVCFYKKLDLKKYYKSYINFEKLKVQKDKNYFYLLKN
jgi:hypothetical protein